MITVTFKSFSAETNTLTLTCNITQEEEKSSVWALAMDKIASITLFDKPVVINLFKLSENTFEIIIGQCSDLELFIKKAKRVSPLLENVWKAEEKENLNFLYGRLPNDIQKSINPFLNTKEKSFFRRLDKKNHVMHSEKPKKLLQRHFPHLSTDDRDEFQQKRIPDDNYYQEKFKLAYVNEYEGLTSRQKQIMTLVKEGDLPSLKMLRINSDEILNLDAKCKTLCNWARHNGHQHVLDYFYSELKIHFEKNSLHVQIESEIAIIMNAINVPNALFQQALNDHHHNIVLALNDNLNRSNSVNLSDFYAALRCNQSDDLLLSILNKNTQGAAALNSNLFPRGFTPLNAVVMDENIKKAQFLLEQQSVDVNSRNLKRQTSLYWAIKKQDVDMINLLMSQANINVIDIDGNGMSALWLAAHMDSLPLVTLFMSHPIHGIPQPENLSTLIISLINTEKPNLEIIKYIAERGNFAASVSAMHRVHAVTGATERGHLEVLQYLFSIFNISAIPSLVLHAMSAADESNIVLPQERAKAMYTFIKTCLYQSKIPQITMLFNERITEYENKRKNIPEQRLQSIATVRQQLADAKENDTLEKGEENLIKIAVTLRIEKTKVLDDHSKTGFFARHGISKSKLQTIYNDLLRMVPAEIIAKSYLITHSHAIPQSEGFSRVDNVVIARERDGTVSALPW